MCKIIVITTPLIALCHVGQLDLLKKMYGEISIPEEVYRELSDKKESMFKTQLHDREVEVMILAKEKSADIVIIYDVNAKKQRYISELKPIIQ